MCKVIEEMRKEEREAATAEATRKEKRMTAHRMLAAGRYAFEEIAAISGLPLDEVKKLQAGQGA